MPNEAVLEQSRFVPGWLHIRHGASTEKLDEIGLMRMPCDERCGTCVEDVRANAGRDEIVGIGDIAQTQSTT